MFQVKFTITVYADFDNRLWYAFMFYAPVVALVMPLLYHDKDAPMTAGGMLVATILFLLSAVICGCVDTYRFRALNLLFVGGSYLIFVLAEGGMALRRRHQAKRKAAGGSPA